ncbi:site-specific integrase [Clostridium botulinum]|uniref:site-specific integrase n=1 Tax=Clostridium botulinum TaxID=1491 RepID=UPI000774B168|nr:site-specific integrase [Clostridium botulinum]AUN23193.1 site-specific integrase [Clostridium botulinum]MBN3372123.1 site-specific integrase [Clostridium botulinum]MBN3375919.1 site-specific integrase [Clostridium botulinum]MBN3420693.1 site-specific integrase [Clostridium botulinum]MBN3448250.1 site-specific integrase [Clostridium botulinum]
MQGSVRKRGNLWSYRIDIGKIGNKRKQKEKGGFKTKKDAQQALNKVLNELNSTGKIFEEKKITFEEIYNNFMENEAPITRKISTITRYTSLYDNHLKNTFGFKYINNITATELQDFIASKTKTLSDGYVRSIYNFILLLFKYAERMEYIKNNITLKVIPPKITRNDDIRIYTAKELKLINERLSTTNLQPAFQIGINLGVRAGECYALRWSDIDFNNNLVNINKQLQYYDKKWCFTSLKTKNSYRKIMFSNRFKKYLLSLKEKQKLSIDFYKDTYKENIIIDTNNHDKPIYVTDFINVKPNGEMLNTYSHKIISRITKKDFGIDFKFHNLRHTHATFLLEKGCNPKYIQERLGHSKLEFTLRLYTHVTKNMDIQAINTLDTILE